MRNFETIPGLQDMEAKEAKNMNGGVLIPLILWGVASGYLYEKYILGSGK